MVYDEVLWLLFDGCLEQRRWLIATKIYKESKQIYF